MAVTGFPQCMWGEDEKRWKATRKPALCVVSRFLLPLRTVLWKPIDRHRTTDHDDWLSQYIMEEGLAREQPTELWRLTVIAVPAHSFGLDLASWWASTHTKVHLLCTPRDSEGGTGDDRLNTSSSINEDSHQLHRS